MATQQDNAHICFLLDYETYADLLPRYADLLVAANQLAKLDKPASHEYRSVNAFIADTKPVIQRESEWIGLREDLVTLRKEREHGHLDAVIEKFINRANNWSNTGAETPNDGKWRRWLDANAKAGKAASWINFLFLAVLVPGLFAFPIWVLSLNKLQDHIGQSIGESTGGSLHQDMSTGCLV